MEHGARNIIDLGEFDQPIGIIGGPYGNLEAMKAALTFFDEEDISPDRLFCTGDSVAYCANPNEVVDLLKHNGIKTILGNCEERIRDNAESCGCGFDAGTVCDRLSANWFSFCKKNLSKSHIEWMKELPDHYTFHMNGKNVMIVHGMFSDISGFVFGSTDWAMKKRELAAAKADIIIGGHCGLPFTDMKDGTVWHNAGVIGMPANDGKSHVWVSTVRPIDEGICFEHYDLWPNFSSTKQKMKKEGLPEEYARTLETGLWDNCDILPEAEKRSQGVFITPRSYLLKNCL